MVLVCGFIDYYFWVITNLAKMGTDVAYYATLAAMAAAAKPIMMVLLLVSYCSVRSKTWDLLRFTFRIFLFGASKIYGSTV